jgi:hypothetical protein
VTRRVTRVTKLKGCSRLGVATCGGPAGGVPDIAQHCCDKPNFFTFLSLFPFPPLSVTSFFFLTTPSTLHHVSPLTPCLRAFPGHSSSCSESWFFHYCRGYPRERHDGVFKVSLTLPTTLSHFLHFRCSWLAPTRSTSSTKSRGMPTK